MPVQLVIGYQRAQQFLLFSSHLYDYLVWLHLFSTSHVPVSYTRTLCLFLFSCFHCVCPFTLNCCEVRCSYMHLVANINVTVNTVELNGLRNAEKYFTYTYPHDKQANNKQVNSHINVATHIKKANVKLCFILIPRLQLTFSSSSQNISVHLCRHYNEKRWHITVAHTPSSRFN